MYNPADVLGICDVLRWDRPTHRVVVLRSEASTDFVLYSCIKTNKAFVHLQSLPLKYKCIVCLL